MKNITKIFYGYGYCFNKIPEVIYEHPEYNKWCYKIHNTINDNNFFFGMILKEIDSKGECYQIPITEKINYNELMEMLQAYRKIFNEKPGIAHYYIIHQIL